MFKIVAKQCIMSLSGSGETAMQDVVQPSKGSVRCRIPQRMPSARQKPQQIKPKAPEILRSKWIRPRSNESRSKSRSRPKDDLAFGRSGHNAPRSSRPERNSNQNYKKPSTIPRKVMDTHKATKPIFLPVGLHSQRVKEHPKRLPDQETISKQERSEDLNDLDGAPMAAKASTKSFQSGKIVDLKSNWQQNMTQFEKMKSDLNSRQKAIVEFYTLMRNMHSKMTRLGQKEVLPPSEELRIMNVANLSAEQLLQLCSMRTDDKLPRVGKTKDNQMPTKAPLDLDLDMNKLYAMPSKLVATCEQTLFKRKEIIDWFETLKTEDKGISMDKLSKKINEFNVENEMLKCSLKQAKGDFVKELNEIIEFMRKTVNETVALQLRTEELTYTLSELNSQNADLRKKIHNSDHLRSHVNKAKVEELEKELNEEKTKKKFIRDRLSKAEGQTKMLETALEQAHSHTWSLERNVQQLNEENQALQSKFDTELNKLRESIRENTMYLEKIKEAREKLQTEKEDLEARLEVQSKHYQESLETVKHDMDETVAKLAEAEKKYEETVEEKNSLEVKLESLCTKLVESDVRIKDLVKELEDTKEKLSLAITAEEELSSTKRDFDIAVIELEDYKKKLAEQSKTIKEYENNIKESICLEENLKATLIDREKIISDLEMKKSLLVKQLHESESKMELYEEQLTCLKNNIAEFQEEFGEFENLRELHAMVNQQRAKLLEATRQNGELAEALQKKDVQLEQHVDVIAEQEKLLGQRNGLIKMLTGKDEEHTNIIKLLRNNLELRTQADMDMNQQITEKNAEIESLISNVEARKQQISQLEKIILTLEDQMRKTSTQRKKDQDKINLLKHKMGQYEARMEHRRNDSTSNNFDSLLKIIEDELGTSFDPNNEHDDYVVPKKKYVPNRRPDKLENFEGHKGHNNQTMYEGEREPVPTKIVLGNYVKKTYMATSDEQSKGENVERKRTITSRDTHKWIKDSETNNGTTIKDNNYPPFRGLLPAGSHLNDNLLSRNILLTSNQLRDEKKTKMFKIAGHRL